MSKPDSIGACRSVFQVPPELGEYSTEVQQPQLSEADG